MTPIRRSANFGSEHPALLIMQRRSDSSRCYVFRQQANGAMTTCLSSQCRRHLSGRSPRTPMSAKGRNHTRHLKQSLTSKSIGRSVSSPRAMERTRASQAHLRICAKRKRVALSGNGAPIVPAPPFGAIGPQQQVQITSTTQLLHRVGRLGLSDGCIGRKRGGGNSLGGNQFAGQRGCRQATAREDWILSDDTGLQGTQKRPKTPIFEENSASTGLHGTFNWWAHQDSNLEPKDYESSALTVEL